MADPMQPIQTAPIALGGLLQLKTRGMSPDVLLGTVQPVVDLGQYWLRATRQRYPTVPSQITGAAVDNTFYNFGPAFIQVPQGEAWYVHRATIVAILPAGTGLILGAAVSYYTPPVAAPLQHNLVGDIGDADATGVGVQIAEPFSASDFWLPPGAVIGLYAGYVTLGVQINLVGLEYSPAPLYG